MKIVRYISFLSLLLTVGCSIDNVEPENILLEDNVIQDENSASNVLNRIYNSGLRNGMYGYSSDFFGMGLVGELSVQGTTVEYLGTSLPSLNQFGENNILNDLLQLEQLYSTSYYNINLVNYFIEAIQRGDAGISQERANEMMADARFFRALSHFNLLKVFGKFYDLDSELGVVTSTQPIRGNMGQPRNSVSGTYDLIVEDLEFALENAQNGREHFYVSSTTALALLAKVQLYMQDFESAASSALAVINNSNQYDLAPSFADLFVEGYGPETLIASYMDIDEGYQGIIFQKTAMIPRAQFRELADAQDGIPGDGSDNYETGYDPRFTHGFYNDPNAASFLLGKYPRDINNGPYAVQVLRMAEIYLIYAEAEARRTNGSLSNALIRLNEVRNRVGLTPKPLVDEATLLEDIREEKMLELFCETGEPWFDLVRYDILGDVDAGALKPTITSESQFMAPIPLSALQGNPELTPNP